MTRKGPAPRACSRRTDSARATCAAALVNSLQGRDLGSASWRAESLSPTKPLPHAITLRKTLCETLTQAADKPRDGSRGHSRGTRPEPSAKADILLGKYHQLSIIMKSRPEYQRNEGKIQHGEFPNHRRIHTKPL